MGKFNKKGFINTCLGVMVISMACGLCHFSISKAGSDFKSSGKIVYDIANTDKKDIVIDTSDHSLLKNNIDANTTEIMSLKEFVEQQNTINESFINKDNDLKENADKVSDNLTSENGEAFYYGVLNGTRGFYTDSSKDESTFIPFGKSSVGSGFAFDDDIKTLFSTTIRDTSYTYTATQNCLIVSAGCCNGGGVNYVNASTTGTMIAAYSTAYGGCHAAVLEAGDTYTAYASKGGDVRSVTVVRIAVFATE